MKNRYKILQKEKRNSAFSFKQPINMGSFLVLRPWLGPPFMTGRCCCLFAEGPSNPLWRLSVVIFLLGGL